MRKVFINFVGCYFLHDEKFNPSFIVLRGVVGVKKGAPDRLPGPAAMEGKGGRMVGTERGWEGGGWDKNRMRCWVWVVVRRRRRSSIYIFWPWETCWGYYWTSSISIYPLSEYILYPLYYIHIHIYVCKFPYVTIIVSHSFYLFKMRERLYSRPLTLLTHLKSSLAHNPGPINLVTLSSIIILLCVLILPTYGKRILQRCTKLKLHTRAKG